MNDSNKTIRRFVVVFAMAWVAPLAAPEGAVAAARSPAGATAGFSAGSALPAALLLPSAAMSPLVSAAGHKHDWQREQKRTWVAPKQKKVMTGKSKNGKPIYKWKTVKPGHWKIEYKSRCRKCGKLKKG